MTDNLYELSIRQEEMYETLAALLARFRVFFDRKGINPNDGNNEAVVRYHQAQDLLQKTLSVRTHAEMDELTNSYENIQDFLEKAEIGQ